MSGIGVTIPGEAFCTFAPNITCYPNSNGWPPCCEDDAITCPTDQPDCEDDITGTSYCTFAPNITCYPNSNGWPPCCEDETIACPVDQPDCDDDDITGTSYCTFAPDLECFPNSNGWPPCCEDDNLDCPEERPLCEGSSVPQQPDDSAAPTSAPEVVESTSPPDNSSAEVPRRYNPGGIFVATIGIFTTSLLN